MPENEIRVLITAVDKISSQLDDIDSNIKRFGKDTVKTQERVGDSFNETMSVLQGLGNVASSVDRIFNSYQNTQLRLENAQLRVISAQRRLTELQQQGKTGTYEYMDAVKQLEVAQNNLERANNAVIGAYLNMGVQIVAVIGTIPKLIAGIQAMTAANAGLMASLAPILPILLAIAAVGVATYAQLSGKTEEYGRKFAGFVYGFTAEAKNLKAEISAMETAIAGLNSALNTLTNYYTLKTTEQLEKERELAEARLELTELQAGSEEGLTAEESAKLALAQQKVDKLQSELSLMQARNELSQAEHNLKLADVGVLETQENITGKLQKSLAAIKNTSGERLLTDEQIQAILSDPTNGVVALTGIIEEQNEGWTAANKEYQKGLDSTYAKLKKIYDLLNNLSAFYGWSVTLASKVAPKKAQKGGIVMSPTPIIAGEAGPEAIVPLSRSTGIGGNNITVIVQGSIWSVDELERTLGQRLSNIVSSSMRIR